MIDIIVTTYNRSKLFQRMLASLLEKTVTPYRLFIIDDHSDDGTAEFLATLTNVKALQAVVLNSERKGVTYGVDLLWHIASFHDWYFEEAQYLCYLQDDVEIKDEGWLGLLIAAYEELRADHPIGFFAGYNATEHMTERRVLWGGREVLLKHSTAGQNLVAEKSFWQSIGMIPRLNPDGSERGFPGDGRGSHFDLWLTGCMSKSRFVSTAAAPTSAFSQGKVVMVIPGLVEHVGIAKEHSTWR